MDELSRIEQALAAALHHAAAPAGPPLLAAAMNHAVFPRGARLRPRLCLAVASACGRHDRAAALAAGIAIELLHCASLVHDDLPCFDDADLRRGRPTVHRAFGEPLAVLAGDALIVLAFETIARVPMSSARLAPLIMTLARAGGTPNGICAGQAYECEPSVDLAVYQQAKTGALFAAATAAGAYAANADGEAWRHLGEALGEAYQVADDIRDAYADSEELGKPCGQDQAHGRPNALAGQSLSATIRRMEGLVAEAMAAVPICPGSDDLMALIALEAKRLLPAKLAQVAA